jgi:hypothetical protein
VNVDSTPFDNLASAVVRGEISDVLPRLIGSQARPAS